MYSVLSDNITTVAHLNHLGGNIKDLSDLTKAIFNLAYTYNIDIQAKHLAGKQNIHADRALTDIREQYVSVETGSSHFQTSKPVVRQTYNRQICRFNEFPVPNLQQSPLGSLYERYRRPSAKQLEGAQQFCKSSYTAYTISVESDKSSKGNRDNCRTVLARPTVGEYSAHPVNSTTIRLTKLKRSELVRRAESRTKEELKVEVFSLESEWSNTLSKQGWSLTATNVIKNCLAPSTLRLYNRQISRLRDFCCLHNEHFPPIKASVIADYMCKVAELSNRPNAILTSVLAAFNYLYQVLDIANPCDNNIHQLHRALVKSCTKLPRQKVNILPQEPFLQLFLSWPENEDLTISRLRLKTITLLAFTFMLRASDIAPKSIVHSSASGIESHLVFFTDRVKFIDKWRFTDTVFWYKK